MPTVSPDTVAGGVDLEPTPTDLVTAFEYYDAEGELWDDGRTYDPAETSLVVEGRYAAVVAATP